MRKFISLSIVALAVGFSIATAPADFGWVSSVVQAEPKLSEDGETHYCLELDVDRDVESYDLAVSLSDATEFLTGDERVVAKGVLKVDELMDEVAVQEGGFETLRISALVDCEDACTERAQLTLNAPRGLPLSLTASASGAFDPEAEFIPQPTLRLLDGRCETD